MSILLALGLACSSAAGRTCPFGARMGTDGHCHFGGGGEEAEASDAEASDAGVQVRGEGSQKVASARPAAADRGRPATSHVAPATAAPAPVPVPASTTAPVVPVVAQNDPEPAKVPEDIVGDFAGFSR